MSTAAEPERSRLSTAIRFLSAFRGGALALTVLTLLANAANYLTNIAFSQLLNPVGYGELSALLAIAVVVGMPTSAAQTIVAERVAAHSSRGDVERLRYLIRHAYAHAITVGLVVAGAYALCIPLVIKLLDLRFPGPAIALVPLLVMVFVQPVQLALLQGLSRFWALGLTLLALATSRMAFGIALVLLGGGAGAAIGGQVVGLLVVLTLAAFFTRRHVASAGARAARSGVRRRPTARTTSATVAFVAFSVLANIDVVLGKLILDPHDAGLYAALATIAKIAMFLPAGLVFMIAPGVARARAENENPQGVLRRNAVLVLAVGALVLAAMAIFPTLIVHLTFGTAYDQIIGSAWIAAIAGALLSLLYSLCTYSAALGDRRWYLVPVAGIAVQVGMIFAIGDRPRTVMVAQALTVGAILVANELFGRPFLRRDHRTEVGPTPAEAG